MDTNEQLSIEELIERIFDFSSYSDEEKQALIEELSANVMQVSILRCVDEGGEEVQEAFNDFIATEPSDDQMATFVTEQLPNFQAVLIEELKQFQEATEKNTTE